MTDEEEYWGTPEGEPTPEIPEFSIADVVAKVREIVARDPARKYVRGNTTTASTCSCLYVHESPGVVEAGCLIAQALYELGVPLPYLRTREGISGADVVRQFAVFSVPLSYANLTRVEWLGKVQSSQDQFAAWGECVIYANTDHDLDSLSDDESNSGSDNGE